MGEGLGGCPAYLPEVQRTVPDGPSPTPPLKSLLKMRRESRLTFQENTGSEYSSLRLGPGKAATLQILMSGAMGTVPHTYVLHRCAAYPLTLFSFSSEIKFGALFDHLPQGTQFLATGQPTTFHLLCPPPNVRISRSLCT